MSIISDAQNNLNVPLLKSDENNDITEKIDQFDSTTAYNNLSDYWNQSVKTFYDNLGAILPIKDNFDNTNGNGHDAGYNFESSPYVNPNENKLEEKYEDARQDESKKVLQADTNMDYTIGDSKTVSDEVKKYMTRLLMPQYNRRVEIEDLDRNFWVISQNLTALNEFAQDLTQFPIDDLIKELTGLWDNIYRIWQAISELEDSMNNYFLEMNNDDKIRLMFDYGYGVLDNDKNNNAVIFTKSNAAKYGILPWISKTKLKNDKYGDSKYVYYVQYNKKLTDDFIGTKLGEDDVSDPLTTQTINNKTEKIGEVNKNLISKLKNNKGGLIRLESNCKTKRNMIKVLRKIRQRNLTLIGYSTIDVFSGLISIDHPFSRVLDFYRDYLYLTVNAAGEESLDSIFGNTDGLSIDTHKTEVWKQTGYLKFLDLLGSSNDTLYNDEATWSDNNVIIPDEIINAFKFIQILTYILNNNGIKYFYGFTNKYNQSVAYNVNAYRFIDAVAGLSSDKQTIAGLKTKFSNENLESLIKGFYEVIIGFYNYFKSLSYTNNYSTDYSHGDKGINNEGWEYQLNSSYTVFNENHLFGDLAKAIKKYEKEESIDGFGTFVIYDGSVLPYVNWDLVSMTNTQIGANFTTDLLFSTGGNNFTDSLSENTDFGNSYFYKWQDVDNQEHIWVDFVNYIYDTTEENGDYEKKDTKSTIGTYTENDPKESGFNADKSDLLYDFIITIPLKKPDTDDEDYEMPAYEDFIRFNKPYPNILAIETDNASSSSLDDTSVFAHIENLSDCYIWLVSSNDENNTKSCYDGFYCLTKTDYASTNILLENSLLDTNKTIHGVSLASELLYHIASSDLIDYAHTEKGQTRIANTHNFKDPIVNLRFLNGRDYSQEIEIVITKDSNGDVGSKVFEGTDTINLSITHNIKTESTVSEITTNSKITSLAGATMVTIGGFFPTTLESLVRTPDTSNTLSIKRVNDKENEITSHYNSGVYGIGSYVFTADYDNIESLAENTTIGYISYEDKIKENVTISEKDFEKVDNLEDEYIEKNGIARIESLIDDRDHTKYENIFPDFTKNYLIMTRIPTKFWYGESGSQWSEGKICDLFLAYYNKSSEKYSISPLSSLDFFETNPTYTEGDTTHTYLEVDGTTWRRIMFVPVEITIEKEETNSETNIYTNGQGYLFLLDKNVSYSDFKMAYGSPKTEGSTGDDIIETNLDVYNNLMATDNVLPTQTMYNDDEKYDRLVAYRGWKIENGKFILDHTGYAREKDETDFSEYNGDKLFYNLGYDWFENNDYVELNSWHGPTTYYVDSSS